MTNNDQTSRPFWKQALRALAWDLLLVAVLASASELSLRFLIPSVQSLVYTKDKTGGHPVVLNSAKLRDEEVSPDFPADGVRIILLGNSVTFGSGIAVEDAFAGRLDALLKLRHDGVKYDVINGGGQGDAMQYYFSLLDDHGFGFNPDAVALILTSNHVAGQKLPVAVGQAKNKDQLISSIKRIPFEAHLFLFGNFYTYVAFDRLIRQSLFAAGLTRESLNRTDNYLYGFAVDVPAVKLEKVDADYDELARSILELKRRLESRGIKFLIIAIPNRFELSNLRRDNHRNVPLDKIRILPGRRFKRIAEQNGIPFMDMLPVFKAKRREMLDGKISYDPLYVTFDSIHLNPTGHRLVAESLEQMLIANGIVPRKK